MIIKNQSKGIVISKNAKFAKSFLDRLLGLINPKNPRFLIFKTRFGIHTFFLREKIDLILLDNKQNVVKVKAGLKPNRLFLYNPKFSIVLEMPTGTIKKCRIGINDKISFE